MKITLLALCFLCTTSALGQMGATLSNEVQVYDVPSHPQQATHRPMGTRQDLREGSDVVEARGERPLWEVAPKTKVVPLGDIARMLRKQHETAPKAEIIWEN
jgi:hypothetical protein